MNYPRLKNALLCRILVYVVALGGFIATIMIVANLKFVPEAVKIIVGIGFAIGLLIYLIKNFALLMAMDVVLAMLHCHNTARKHFALPQSFSEQKIERRISRFGKKYEPSAISPRPETLRYKSNAPVTIYSSGKAQQEWNGPRYAHGANPTFATVLGDQFGKIGRKLRSHNSFWIFGY